MGLIIASLFVYIDPTLQEGRQVMSLASLACQMMAMMSERAGAHRLQLWMAPGCRRG